MSIQGLQLITILVEQGILLMTKAAGECIVYGIWCTWFWNLGNTDFGGVNTRHIVLNKDFLCLLKSQKILWYLIVTFCEPIKKKGVFKVSLILKDFKRSWTLMNVEFFYSKFIAYQIQPLPLRF